MANRVSYYLGMTFTVLSFVLCLIGFGTGYWWVSTEDDSWFTRTGLWEVCFNGYEHTSDLIGKAYYGCWWIFYPEYYYIQDWLLPSWFIAVQTLMTFAVVFQFLALVLFPLSYGDVDNIRNLIITCVNQGLMLCCLATSVTIFGVMVGEDRTWLPGWHNNVMGWSYGLVVVAGFFSIFSFIGIVTYTLQRKYDIELSKQQSGAAEPLTKKAMLPKA